jgi:hypothetical protein
MADSPLLKKQNNNTATAALRRFRQPGKWRLACLWSYT